MEYIPFIVFLYEDEVGERKTYYTDWPTQFVNDFTDKVIIRIGGFYVCGTEQKIESLNDAFKICNG